MKKKLIVATVLILLLAVCLSMLVGCDEMFTKNAERDAMQVVASVKYGNQSANIYKFELQASFNSYSYAYVNYYGMTYKQATEYILQSLAQQKLLALYARQKITDRMDNLTEIPEDLSKLLTKSEYDRAIDNANDSLMSSLKTLVEEAITEDNYNTADTEETNKPEDDKEVEITDPIYVRFESNGGSTVERQRIQNNTKAKEPEEPTKDGYTFYGWYQDPNFSEKDPRPNTDNMSEEAAKELIKQWEKDNAGKGEFDFDTQINVDTEKNSGIMLYAKWVEYTAPRTEMPEVEEEEEDDYDPDDDTVEISPMFFSKEFYDPNAEKFEESLLFEEILEEDFVEKIKVPEGSTLNKELKTYVDNALATLRKNISSNIFKHTDEGRYEYYLNNQIDSLLVTKLQRLIGKDVEKGGVLKSEVEKEYQSLVNKNKETFSGVNADSSYSSALTGSLSSTYYHTETDKSYGFVQNILLRLDEDSLKILTDMCKADPTNAEAVKIVRNRLISKMEVKVSNPNYDSKEVVKDADGKEIKLRDPMTDGRNPYNNIGKTGDYNHDYQVDKVNHYNELITFKKVDGKFQIVYGATEHPAMAYLIESVPAFDQGEQVGVIHQIYNSFDQVQAFVKSGELTKEQGVYWLREVATKWLYLVGDDSGAVTDSSNNNGLGYLITPEGMESSYLPEFTDYARNLISKGTGSFFVGEASAIGADTFKGTSSPLATIAGDGVAFVIADSFIGKDVQNYDNAYAGVFVLLNSYTVWDKNAFSDEVNQSGVLPLDYIMTVAKDADDNKTIYDIIEAQILESKKTGAYNVDVNTMGNENMDNIKYYEKAYKSLWKGLD